MNNVERENHLVDIEKILIGERRRDEYGDLDTLVVSMRKYGQRHHITLTDGYVLVDGGRRIEAAKKAGWQQIEAMFIEGLTEEEIRELELEANITAKPYLQFELDKRMVKQINAVADKIEAKKAQDASSSQDQPAPSAGEAQGAGNGEVVTDCNFGHPGDQNKRTSSGKDARGRKKSNKATKEEVASQLGVSKAKLIAAEQHVEAGEKYPDLLKVYDRRSDRTAMAKKLDAMSEEDRSKALKLLAKGEKINRENLREAKKKSTSPKKKAEPEKPQAESKPYHDRDLKGRAEVDAKRWSEFILDLHTTISKHSLEMQSLFSTGDGIHDEMARHMDEEEAEHYLHLLLTVNDFASAMQQFADQSIKVLEAVHKFEVERVSKKHVTIYQLQQAENGVAV